MPIEAVRSGISLAFDEGQGLQLFQVEKVEFHVVRDDEGNTVTTYTLTSGPVPGEQPWVIQLPAGSTVLRVLPPAGPSLFERMTGQPPS